MEGGMRNLGWTGEGGRGQNGGEVGGVVPAREKREK